MPSIETICALLGPLVMFWIVRLVAHPQSFNPGPHLRMIGWDLTGISVAFVLVAIFEQSSGLRVVIKSAFEDREPPVWVLVAVLLVAVYATAGHIRYTRLDPSETIPGARCRYGLFSWLIGIFLLTVFGKLAHPVSRQCCSVLEVIAPATALVIAIAVTTFIGSLIYLGLTGHFDPQALSEFLESRCENSTAGWSRWYRTWLWGMSRDFEIRYLIRLPLHGQSWPQQFALISKVYAWQNPRAVKVMQSFVMDDQLPEEARALARGLLRRRLGLALRPDTGPPPSAVPPGTSA
jgi:FtsH-binding integral membrane protein